MIEEIKYHGIWWITTKPENKISGVLEYDPRRSNNKISLDLDGVFEEDHEMHQYDIILGSSRDGRLITLHNCYEVSKRPGSGYPTSRYSVRTCFDGFLFPTEESIRFKTMSVNYSQFEEWFGMNPFKTETVSEGSTIDELHITYFHRDPELIHTKDYTISLSGSLSYALNLYSAPELGWRSYMTKRVSAREVQLRRELEEKTKETPLTQDPTST
jgi:hypothetical protein